MSKRKPSMVKALSMPIKTNASKAAASGAGAGAAPQRSPVARRALVGVMRASSASTVAVEDGNIAAPKAVEIESISRIVAAQPAVSQPLVQTKDEATLTTVGVDDLNDFDSDIQDNQDDFNDESHSPPTDSGPNYQSDVPQDPKLPRASYVAAESDTVDEHSERSASPSPVISDELKPVGALDSAAADTLAVAAAATAATAATATATATASAAAAAAAAAADEKVDPERVEPLEEDETFGVIDIAGEGELRLQAGHGLGNVPHMWHELSGHSFNVRCGPNYEEYVAQFANECSRAFCREPLFWFYLDTQPLRSLQTSVAFLHLGSEPDKRPCLKPACTA
jgi:hypothetical protein